MPSYFVRGKGLCEKVIDLIAVMFSCLITIDFLNIQSNGG